MPTGFQREDNAKSIDEIKKCHIIFLADICINQILGINYDHSLLVGEMKINGMMINFNDLRELFIAKINEHQDDLARMFDSMFEQLDKLSAVDEPLTRQNAMTADDFDRIANQIPVVRFAWESPEWQQRVLEEFLAPSALVRKMRR